MVSGEGGANRRVLACGALCLVGRAGPGWFSRRRPSHCERARVAERQTRWLQVPVSERAWGFKSPLAHKHLGDLPGAQRAGNQTVPGPFCVRPHPNRRPPVTWSMVRRRRVGARNPPERAHPRRRRGEPVGGALRRLPGLRVRRVFSPGRAGYCVVARGPDRSVHEIRWVARLQGAYLRAHRRGWTSFHKPASLPSSTLRAHPCAAWGLLWWDSDDSTHASPPPQSYVTIRPGAVCTDSAANGSSGARPAVAAQRTCRSTSAGSKADRTNVACSATMPFPWPDAQGHHGFSTTGFGEPPRLSESSGRSRVCPSQAIRFGDGNDTTTAAPSTRPTRPGRPCGAAGGTGHRPPRAQHIGNPRFGGFLCVRPVSWATT
jgi:hypothetical protein